MAAIKGRDILLKRETSAGSGTFTAFAGLRSKSIQINKEQVDITSADDTSRWRQLLFGASVRSLSVSGSGVLKDDAQTKAVFEAALADTSENWQVVVPGIGTFEGAFMVSFTLAGEHAGEATYDITLESAGDQEFVAD